MANQTVSPNEAEVARRLLTEKDSGPIPDNQHGDVTFIKRYWYDGKWVPLFTSNHFPDDDPPLGRRTTPRWELEE
jgi:hypothetical protein